MTRFLNWLAMKSPVYKEAAAAAATSADWRYDALKYRGALCNAIGVVDGLKAPNGSLNKVRRIATDALESSRMLWL